MVAGEVGLQRARFETEIILRVVIADIADQFPSIFMSCGSAPDNVAPDEVAEQSAEVLVARIGKETARIGDHADKTTEQAEVRERVDLPLHAFQLIEEPPAAPNWSFPGCCHPGNCRASWRTHSCPQDSDCTGSSSADDRSGRGGRDSGPTVPPAASRQSSRNPCPGPASASCGCCCCASPRGEAA